MNQMNHKNYSKPIIGFAPYGSTNYIKAEGIISIDMYTQFKLETVFGNIPKKAKIVKIVDVIDDNR